MGIGSRLSVDVIASCYDRHLREHATGKLLDLGCGKVPLYESYREWVSTCICVDWSNTAHKNLHLDYECDLTETLPFGDGEFDTVILSDVLEHIPTPEALCHEIARILATNGKLIMNVPFLYCLHEEPYDFFRYTEFALRRFMEVSGLKLISLEPTGGSPEVLADFLAKSFAHVPLMGRALAMFMQWVTLCFVRTRFGRKVSQATGKKFPFGYFLVAAKTA